MQERKVTNCSNSVLYPDGRLRCDIGSAVCPCAEHSFGKPGIYEIDLKEHRKVIERAQKQKIKVTKSKPVKAKRVTPTHQRRLF